MIQRIQSIFLLIASGGFGSLFAFPFASSEKSFGTVFSDSMLNLSDNIGLLVLAIVGGILSLVAIFLFHNRKLQKMTTWLSVMAGFALAGLSFGIYTKHSEDLANTISMDLGFGMPVLSIVMGILAIVFIGKDDKLVKSMDRLR